ncbi:hypothetical protein [Vogesella sp. XCS3]|uniref:hypothetical protein n=1 Tax=Vogesella sp. XCS3 TaxID=2877939 RepID=UPI001D09D42A|nr:hypothetical protein [Vogesella sp. XCS3]UDM18989.1 hypothetical protein LCH97_18265 [Vogesella sp. XCS3]
MSNKYIVLFLLIPAIVSAETIDRFAKGTLSAAPGAPAGVAIGLPAIPTGIPPIPVAGGQLPGKDGSTQLFDIVFIQGKGNLHKVYLVIDGKYGKLARAGDVVQGWKIQKIGEDFVDISKGKKIKRLLMDAGTATSDQR